MALKIVWNDILKECADAIVTPASRNPRIGIGLDKFVHQAAGPKLLAARREMGRIAPGKVGVSSAFGLRKTTGAKWIIHALGPMLGKSGDRREELILDGCYLRILLTAVRLGCKTVSIPVLSSGKFASGVSVMPKAVDIAVNAISDFLEAFPALEVKLVGIDVDFFGYARKAYPALTVARLDEAAARKLRASFGDREDDPTDLEDSFTIGDEDDVFGDQLLERIDATETARGLGMAAERAVDFVCDGTGLDAGYAAVNRAVTNVRNRRRVEARDADGSAWRDNLDRDYIARKLKGKRK